MGLTMDAQTIMESSLNQSCVDISKFVSGGTLRKDIWGIFDALLEDVGNRVIFRHQYCKPKSFFE